MAKSRSFRFRFTLRALLVGVTLFMLWGGYHTNRGWKERAAEEVLRRHGATFDYRKPQPQDSAWQFAGLAYQRVVQLLWRERCIAYVTINSQLEPDLVEALTALPHLETLRAQPERLSREEFIRRYNQGDFEPAVRPPAGAIQQIMENKRLRSLTLGVWVLSEEDCKAIADHRTLESVDVFGSDLSEVGLARLLTLPRLRGFGFAFCDVTGERLKGVPGSPTLEGVRCEASHAGTDFAAFLGRSPNVRKVLSGSRGMNDEFVAALGAHPRLAYIELPFATDRSVPVLVRMPALEHVVFSDKRLSNKGVDQLRRANPKLNVVLTPFRDSWTTENTR